MYEVRRKGGEDGEGVELGVIFEAPTPLSLLYGLFEDILKGHILYSV